MLGLFIAFGATAQDGNHLAEANTLYDSRNYLAAIEKYRAALALDTGNVGARYKLAFSLHTVGKSKEAISEFEQVVKQERTPQHLLSSSYSLLGGLYDKTGAAAKAIESYQKALALDPNNHLLSYGLGLAYFRSHQYSKAEQAAIKSLQLSPGHAASMRLYALVTFHQNKRAPALLALCNFLWLEPKGAFAAESWNNMQSILKGGVLKGASGVKGDSETVALNQALNNAASTAGNQAARTKLVQEQLRGIFRAVTEVAEKRNADPFFLSKAKTFGALSKTDHFPTFVNYIIQHSDKTAAAWVASHPQQVVQMNAWIKERLGQ